MPAGKGPDQPTLKENGNKQLGKDKDNTALYLTRMKHFACMEEIFSTYPWSLASRGILKRPLVWSTSGHLVQSTWHDRRIRIFRMIEISCLQISFNICWFTLPHMLPVSYLLYCAHLFAYLMRIWVLTCVNTCYWASMRSPSFSENMQAALGEVLCFITSVLIGAAVVCIKL